MKFGFRKPSIKKRISARTSIKRQLTHRAGLKMPKGYGWLRSPKKYGYNKVSLNGLRGCLGVRFFVWRGLFN
ncbi:MAG: hypothetical protein ACMXYF_06110 [Candidatus Woesearchaeota archaeon]